MRRGTRFGPIVLALAGIFFLARPAAADPLFEAKLRAVIADLQNGTPRYDDMAPRLSRAYRGQEQAARAQLLALGALKTLTYKGVEDGAELYEAKFDNGVSFWAIGFAPDGKIDMLVFR